MRRALAVLAVIAALAAVWLAADAWRASRIPHSGRPLEMSFVDEPKTPSGPAQAPRPSTLSSAAITASLIIDWQDPNGQMYRSEIALTPDAKAPTAASILTRDRSSGQELVRYNANATRLASGTLIIDAEGAAVSGPLASEWAADSFTIARDGQVTTQDARSSPGEGLVVQEEAFTPEK